MRALASHVLALLLLGGCSAREAIPPRLADADLGEAALLASVCSGCHAAGGQVLVDLSSYSAAALAERLLAYQQQRDGPSAMHRMARGYTERELRLIAEHLGVPR